MGLLDSLIAPFDSLVLREAGGLGPARRAALAAVQRDGLPGSRSEAWKYTSLRALERRAFAVPQPPRIGSEASLEIPSPRMVFVNGHLDTSLTDLAGLPDGVSIEPLSSMLARSDEQECATLAHAFDQPHELFARLNVALAEDGMVLRAGPEVRAGAAVHLVCLGTPDGVDAAWHLRHVVQVGEGASIELVEHHLGDAPHAHLSNQLTHVRLGPGASLTHARRQDESTGATLMTRTDAVLASDAQYTRVDLELGGALSRHELNVRLEGRGAVARCNGVLLATGRRHVDTRLGLDHVGPDTRCELTWRGLGAGRGRVAFHGGILIREGADGSDATLSNKNLLLSEGAEIDTQPVLEIHADEVKAAHGATVGQLDPNALFYLRSRGVGSTQARAMLTAAFLRETLAVMGDAGARELLTAALDDALVRESLA